MFLVCPERGERVRERGGEERELERKIVKILTS